MKINEEYYVLIKLGEREEGCWTKKDSTTKFLGEDDELVDDVRKAIRYGNKKTAITCLQEYEDKHNQYGKSGFNPIFVTTEIVY